MKLLVAAPLAVSAMNLFALQELVSLGKSMLSLEQPSRLLEFGPGDRRLATEADFLAYKRQGMTFMDVTDHVDLYDSFAVMDRDNVEFPTELTHVDQISKLFPQVSVDHMTQFLTNFSSFYTRYYKSASGAESSAWLQAQAQAVVDGADAGDKVTVQSFPHSFAQSSVIAHIEGSKHPEHIVILSAHQDSINLLAPLLLPAPGADDDGSGTTSVFEAFKVLVESGFSPENSVEFHWYAAEEGGLLGSQDVCNQYAKDGKLVKATLQVDMTGYIKKAQDAGLPETIGVFEDVGSVNLDLVEFVRTLVEPYTGLTQTKESCGYACSDHDSAYKVGYPSSFVSEGPFNKFDPFIHTSADILDKLSVPHMAKFSQLGMGFVAELGDYEF